jgi:hypothetical protein
MVLIVISIMTLACFTFTDLMQNENRAAALSGRQLQTQEAAQSAVDFLIQYLSQEAAFIENDGGLYDNPNRFQGILFMDSDAPRNRLRVTIISPGVDLDSLYGVRYGLEDESSRLNLTLLAAMIEDDETDGLELLMQFPGMTEEIADAILDWFDADSEVRETGAEYEYYSSMLRPYMPQNGPPNSVSELLLIKGVTPELLFGPDVNRTFYIDLEEQKLYDSMSGVNQNDMLNGGWARYLTMYSAEANLRPNGEPKIDLNGEDLQVIYDEMYALLGPEMADFFVLLRQSGPYEDESQQDEMDPDADPDADPEETPPATDPQGTPNENGQIIELEIVPLETVDIDLEQEGGETLESIFGLVGVMVQIGSDEEQQGQGGAGGGGAGGGGGGGGQPIEGEEPPPEGEEPPAEGEEPMEPEIVTVQVVQSPFTIDPIEMSQYFPVLLDNFTIGAATSIPARININQATGAVLRTIPNIEEDMVQQIVGARVVDTSTGQNATFKHPTWLLTEGVVNLDQMKQLWPYITSRGAVYRAQIVAFYEEGGGFSRFELILDATQLPPRVLSLKDITHLGRGFDLQTLGASSDVLQ